MMLRLEPGDVMCFAFPADLAEAHEGVHLVLVAVDRLCHGHDLRDVEIGRDLDEIVVVFQPKQQAIEDRETLGIAMEDRGLGELDEFCRHVEGAIASRRQRCWRQWREQLGFAALYGPGDVGRIHLVKHEATRGFAPAVEIGFVLEGDVLHQKPNPSCVAFGLNRSISRASSRRCGAGRWSLRTMNSSALLRGTCSRARSATRIVVVRRAAIMRSTALVPKPGTRNSSSRLARLTSSGKRSRWRNAQASFGSMSSGSIALSSTISPTSKP